MGKTVRTHRTLDTALALAAAFRHPDVAIRERMGDLLDAYRCDCHDGPPPEAIERCLLAASATAPPLEPFTLDDDQLRLATLAVGIAFTNPQCTTVRVVSRETIGVNGGFVLTRDLSGHHVSAGTAIERRAAGYRFVAPAALDDCLRAWGDQSSPSCRVAVTAALTGRGIELSLPTASLSALPGFTGKRPQDIQRFSTVGPDAIPISAVGLRVEADGDRTCIIAGSPESLLRFTAHASARSPITLAAESHRTRSSAVAIRLQMPDGNPLHLAGVPILEPRQLTCWIRVTPPSGIGLQRVDRVAIARWLGLPAPWHSDRMLDLLQ